jgi:NAD(P)-dependent dehydrogenase (short-subunit alcohol dehydrogenase family)
MPGRLEGKAGIITGGAAGLGRAVVQVCVREGARIVVFDRDAEQGICVVEAITATGGSAIFHQGDVSDEADIVSSIARCLREFGTFNIMDNNAALAVEHHLHETSAEEWDLVMAVNLRGTFLGCKHGVVAMREHGGGSIVNTSSISGLTGDPTLPAYGTTKTGIIGLTRVVAVDYAAEGIRCNAVCPGDMDTPMLQRTFARAADPAALRHSIENSYPMKRIADPFEVAEAVLFLLSDESSFITGSVLVADGGLTAKCY